MLFWHLPADNACTCNHDDSFVVSSGLHCVCGFFTGNAFARCVAACSLRCGGQLCRARGGTHAQLRKVCFLFSGANSAPLLQPFSCSRLILVCLLVHASVFIDSQVTELCCARSPSRCVAVVVRLVVWCVCGVLVQPSRYCCIHFLQPSVRPVHRSEVLSTSCFQCLVCHLPKDVACCR